MDKLFISLCEKYHKKIIKYLYYSVGNIEDAKDLTQEVFVIVYNRIGDLQKHDNIGGFIYQTAKYLAANFKRKNFKKTSMETSIDEDFLSDYSDVYDELQTQYDKKIDENCYIDYILKKLSEEKQLLYKLYYVDNKNYKEIAKMLNINQATLRMRYVRLRREIKKLTHNVAKENFI
ncbi:RNA polymerase sigma factor [Maledivibacter halophilus]|uniref:RNA polymerase sigma-70 factor, ECF subfamily n=1 Tax=Maledivibacter halophilus TaxID=36842 RepID=A0A1T5M9L2_9FIRM|nr:sigma-70 family RNA polymerase sigma factor [Maledivibacter halophilus]SKC84783.1 RNA polymerase sigma-70 factor, ECF subfamily [Maledivibacter halophilus]